MYTNNYLNKEKLGKVIAKNEMVQFFCLPAYCIMNILDVKSIFTNVNSCKHDVLYTLMMMMCDDLMCT